jgi:putative flavoprotein involved in K+ transport
MKAKDTEFELAPGAGTLVEAGDAFTRLSVRAQHAPRAPERFDVVVVGAGQAGLSVGYHLSRRGLRFVIVDGADRIGDSWRKRWDSLRLFTPARYDALDGMPFPGDPYHFPTKDEMADYLEHYARHFALPVRLRTRVQRLSRCGERYQVTTSDGVIEADQVVVAMASYQRQRTPAFARELAPHIVQVRSDDYKSPAQLTAGLVLITGAGNSGSEIAMELQRSHPVIMSGRDTGEVPFRLGSFWGLRVLGPFVLRFLFHRLLTVGTPMGRKLRQHALAHGGPLIRVRSKDLAEARVQRVPRVVGVRDGLPLLEDGRTLDVKNLVWCNGYDAGFDWIDLPILDERGEPRHLAGIVPEAPGLFFVGLHFLYSMSSTMIHGVGRDAERIARAVTRRASERECSRVAAA